MGAEGCGTALEWSRFGAEAIAARREAHWPSSRPQLRDQRGLRADQHLDRVAHADRRGNGAHGAERTAPAEQRLPEFLTIGDTQQLADVRAGLAGAVHSQRHASDAELRVYGQV